MTTTRILLADDHAVLRAGLRLLIEAQADMVCVGEAGDGLETLARAEQLQPDLVLLDLSMPRLGGLAALPEIRRKAPQTRILVLTMHADEEYLRQCLKGGAAGYVLKQAADQELLLAIRAVMRDEVYIHPAMTRGLLGDLVDSSRDLSGSGKPERAADLSDREAEVIIQVARGHTNQEIADQLSLSIKTVETYRARAMEKLGLTSRAELVRYALKRGWLEERAAPDR
jgi:two-component system response regulator NreC